MYSNGSATDVTVIIPVYGGRNYLNRALDSIRNQTLLPHEVIIVDDASPIPIIVEDSWPFPIQTRRLNVNSGAGVARNVGAEFATSPILAFLDADDVMLPHYIEYVSSKWSEFEDSVGLLAVGFYWCDEVLQPYRLQALPNYTEITKADLLKRANFVGGCSVLSVRAAAFRACSGYPLLRACQDLGLMLNIVSNYRILCLSEPCILYMSPTFNSMSMTRNIRRSILSICKLYRDFDRSDRGRGYAIKSWLVLYLLVRDRRLRLAIKVFLYSLKKYHRLDVIVIKAVYELAVPVTQRQIVNRLRVKWGKRWACLKRHGTAARSNS